MAEREILFRGKRVDNGKWVEGGYIPLDVDSGYTYIIESCNYASTFSALDLIKLHSILVIIETVGQFTGLVDKNNVRIFEGDIIKTDDGRIGVVYYSSEKTAFVAKNIKTYKEIQHWTSQVKSSEVIGNIYDNPELMKGGADNDR